MRFAGKNFQAWEKFELRLEGLTSVIGRSDLGKSSLFRALKAVTRNDFPVRFIRKGTKESSVTLEDSCELELVRSAKDTKYLVAGEEYKKLAGGVPEEVDALGFGLIKIGELKLDPIFAGQFDDQFGLTMAPMQINQMLGAFAATEKLEAGKREANRQITEINSEVKVWANEVSGLESKLVKLEDTKDSWNQWSITYGEVEEGVRTRVSGIDILSGMIQDLGALQTLTQTLKAIPMIEFAEIHRLDKTLEDLSVLLDLQASLQAIPRIPPVPSLDKGLSESLQAIEEILVSRSKLSSIPVIPEVDLQEGKSLVSACEALSALLEGASGLRDVEAKLQALEAETKKIEEELSEIRSKEIECPQCSYRWIP